MYLLNDFQKNRQLQEVSTFGIGGPSRYFVEIRTIEQAQQIMLFCHKQQMRYFILGKGSNCLFSDQGFDGLVILNKIDFFESSQPGIILETEVRDDKVMQDFELESFANQGRHSLMVKAPPIRNDYGSKDCFNLSSQTAISRIIHVGAGYSFSLLGTKTARQELSGLEFASGIPGSVGGAVYMNAGANGTDTSRTLLSVDYITDKGELQILPKEYLNFSYRTSPFQSISGIIVGATFLLERSVEARQKQLSIIEARRKSQPLKEMSAGCVFRNPSCGHAGKMIEQCNLKGMRIGGAEISTTHANFLINAENASSKDVLDLIQLVKMRVKEKFSLDLEVEIRYIS